MRGKLYKIASCILFLCIFMTSCEEKVGVDVGGDETIEVTFKTEETDVSHNSLTAKMQGMKYVFQAVITVIERENSGDSGYRAEDEKFVSDTLTVMLNSASSADSSIMLDEDKTSMLVTSSLINDYAHACFADIKDIPNLFRGDDVIVIYDKNIIDTADTVEITDVLNIDGESCMAYVNCYDDSGNIKNMYIFKLLKVAAPAESSLDLGYSVKTCTVVE